MTLKKGDILDERKRFPDSCGLVIKITGGGEGFAKIVCCGHDLTEDDRVTEIADSRGRKKGLLPPGSTLEENRQFPGSCGLRVMIIDGGAGLSGIHCCGHVMTVDALNDLRFGQMRATPPEPDSPAGHA